MADMVSYGDRVYCVACCDSVSKILYLHFHIPGSVCVGVPLHISGIYMRCESHLCPKQTALIGLCYILQFIHVIQQLTDI